jgi:hypothetical protein
MMEINICIVFESKWSMNKSGNLCSSKVNIFSDALFVILYTSLALILVQNPLTFCALSVNLNIKYR